ncbi:hypothetical protein ELI47_38505 [Rhizobium ruizarguesonis]|uniref:hypothetical protein n=1 Tax=Rhizobium ruizarguesonis TaxID=2081791 RepID=UPI001031E762|nr:hypothetical protein [Rhizobium ruizarguesonis]TAU14705.1 hypothetical protein ELI47_38505 [Rhizobium ruizarguesonis]
MSSIPLISKDLLYFARNMLVVALSLALMLVFLLGITSEASARDFDVSALVKPSSGLRPQEFFVWNHLVVLNHPDTHGQTPFLYLMALGLRPNHIEDRGGSLDWAAQFANWFLPQNNPTVFYGAGWKGQDEFEKADSRKAFLDRFEKVLQDMAPKPPFQFAYTVEFNLPTYDAPNGGFVIGGDTLLMLRSMYMANGAVSLAVQQPNQISFDADYDIPEKMLWAADESVARSALKKVRAQSNEGRTVRLLAVLEAVSGDPNLLTLKTRLKKLAIYDQSLTNELFSFDVAALNHQHSSVAAKSEEEKDPTLSPAFLRLPPGDQTKIRDETQLFVRDCKIKSSYATFHNCACLGQHYMSKRISDPNEEISKVTDEIRLDCVEIVSTGVV